MEDKSFEILHFSYRHWKSFHPEGCYRLNLIFRASDKDDEYYSTKQRFLDECKEWKKSEIITDLELYEKYKDGLQILDADTGRELFNRRTQEEKDEDDREYIPIKFSNTNNIEREDVYIKGYQENFGTMFQYIEKFDVFRFYEYFEINPATKGIIQYIEQLKEMSNPDTYYAGQFLRALESLQLWWD